MHVSLFLVVLAVVLFNPVACSYRVIVDNKSHDVAHGSFYILELYKNEVVFNEYAVFYSNYTIQPGK